MEEIKDTIEFFKNLKTETDKDILEKALTRAKADNECYQINLNLTKIIIRSIEERLEELK